MNQHGISPEWQDIIKHTLRPFADKIEKVGLFGSRATGTFKANSDIDMVIYGNLAEADIDRLWTLLDDSALPVKVDANAYNLIDYDPLKQHIDKTMLVLFDRQSILSTH